MPLGPGDPMTDMLSAAAFRAAGAAQNIGIFEALRGGPLTSTETATRLRTDERGIRLLLDTLEAFGYVTREDGRYANSPMSAEWLAPAEGPSFAPAMEFWNTILFRLWNDLEQSIRSGEPPLDFYQWLERNPATLANFQTMLRTIARAVAVEVVAKVRPPAHARRLIDIGGGHAEYSVAFCRENPDLSAVVFDFPGALQTGHETIAAAGMTDRVSTQPGNFLTDALGTGYDVALLMSVVHGHQPDANIDLLRRVASALNPGGQVVILEQLADTTDATATPFNRVFSLNLFHLQGGQTYPFDEIARWLRIAGFTDVQRIDLTDSPGDGVVVASKS